VSPPASTRPSTPSSSAGSNTAATSTGRDEERGHRAGGDRSNASHSDRKYACIRRTPQACRNWQQPFHLPWIDCKAQRTTKAGCNTRTYDQAKAPDQRLRDENGFLNPLAQNRLRALHGKTNPAELTRNINRIQQALIASAKDKILALRDQASCAK
jgi:hypothetical protein